MLFYSLDDFKNACCRGGNTVKVHKQAVIDAKEIFNLYPEMRILEFICNDGLEDLTPINSKEWENNPTPTNRIMVDAYEFRTFDRYGYIAFMFNSQTNFWIIKSFHSSYRSNPVLGNAIKKWMEHKNE